MKPLRFLISAGPTREFLDPVRFLSNPSSGKMGIALAQAAQDLGHTVRLVHGPCSVPLPRSRKIKSIPVTTALEMRTELLREFSRSDVVVMAAAVTDFRARHPKGLKTPKGAKGSTTLRLVHNPDILEEMGRRKKGQLLVGFSAETHDLLRHALGKLRHKKLDFIVANRVGGKDTAFNAETNRVWVINRGGKCVSMHRLSKSTLSRRLIATFLRERGGLSLTKKPQSPRVALTRKRTVSYT